MKRKPRARIGFAAVALYASLYVVVPHGGVIYDLWWQAFSVLAVSGVAVGVARHRPTDRHAWSWIAAGLLLFGCGDATYLVYDGLGWALPDPGIDAAFYLCGYPMIAMGLALMLRRSTPGRDWSSLIDAAIVASGLSVVAWVFLIEPYTREGSETLAQKVVSIAYPSMDIVLLVLVTRMLLTTGMRSRAFWWLLGGVVLQLVGDTLYGAGSLYGFYANGSVIDLPLVGAYLAFGISALHPSMVRLTLPAPNPERRLSPRRLVLLGVCSVLSPALLCVTSVRAHAGAWSVAVVGGVAMFLLVIARLGGLVEELRQAEERRGEERLSAFILHSTDAHFLVDTGGLISFASPSGSLLVGRPRDTLLAESLLGLLTPESAKGLAHQLASLSLMPKGSTIPLEAQIRDDDGRCRSLEGTACNLLDEASMGGIVVTLRDVTARAELERQLTRRALHDDLTGLPNRALFADRVERAIASSARSTTSRPAVLFIDLDDFKAVNDGLGHGAGDDLLRGVAARIRDGLRPGDTVARLGGDEFAVLVENSPSLDHANEVARRVLELLACPIDVAGVSIAVPASVGIRFGFDGCDVESLLRDADIAMYSAKALGKGRVAIFDESLRDRATERLALKIELPAAVEQRQFRLDYQPIRDLSSHEIVGFEALIRWQHPTRGLLAPAEFISAAEESGLIVEIGLWVLEEACRAAVAWNHEIGRPLSMSVNVSGVQLHHPDFISTLREAIRQSRLSPSLLTLELTESVLVEHERVMAVLQEIRTLGVKVAIDDFGTGYSSLSYLQRFPVTSVKIDRSFVAGLSAAGDPGLVQGVISLAEALNLTTVAEGVETGEQLEALSALGCQLTQGFYTGHPQTEGSIRALLASSGSEEALTPAGLPDRPGVERA